MSPFKYLVASLLLAFINIHTVAAQDFTPPTKTIPAEASGAYTLDKSHANLTASVMHMGFAGYPIRFNNFDATLDFDAADISKSKAKVTVHTGSADSNNSELEAKMQGKELFNTEKFPTATFTSTSITKTSDSKGTLVGDLTLLGVTKPITLDVTFNGYGVNPYSKSPTLGFSATGSFKRSDFGLSAYVPAVSDEVQLNIEAEFNKAK